MKRVGSFVGDWWRLVIPYFKSEERWIAITLLVGAISLTFVAVGLEVLFNDWNRRFYDSLQNKDEAAFWREITIFSLLAAGFIAAGVARAIVSPYLRLRWRRWLTRQYLAHWLDGRGYYRIELQRTVDNADQRIAEDLRQLGEYTMTLLLGILGAVATLISFLFILWNLSGPLSLKPIGIDITIPGYMAWVALIYAVIGTFFANLVGRRLIPLNFQRQRYEANFRFSLVRVRENAEGIALYRGEEREAEVLNQRFADVFANGWQVLFTQAQLALYQVSYGQIAIIFPYIVTAPGFFSGALTLGVVMQTASAFGQVQGALSFFIDNYTYLAELRAVMDRLMGLQKASDAKPATSIEVAPEPGRSDLGAAGLTLGLPNGQALLADATFALPRGRSTLITGASGSGKSTLFRALAGIWPFGKGQVRVPAGARVLFLPQKPYIPIGTLRDAVKYPDEQSTASDAEIVSALEAVKLGHIAGRMDEVAHWTNILSGGEQQRLAVARALVFKPDWLFLDEATASLDEAMETAVYEALKQRLPAMTMVSIGHRPSLRQWHDRQIELRRGQGEVGRLVEA
ncbi:ABC transporter ATP-binding protein/permease [Reyranella soli]|uniref:ATP-binding protein n=1 Tax=Reyranella soli TaxID=1230389 RepID=A0A512NNK2_9HYPH|nr:ABC transporter ATP-binding protein/permease [Reyranella soli]GEP60509.1 ATP-binding protein [Reyranella soli]